MKQKKKSAYWLGIGHCAVYEWEIWVGWLDRPKHRSRCPSAGAGGHGGLVAGARVIAIMLCTGAGVIAVILCECVRADSCAVCRGGSKVCNNS